MSHFFKKKIFDCFCAKNRASVYVGKLYIKINFQQDLLLCVLELQVKAWSLATPASVIFKGSIYFTLPPNF